jgi:hypothetical protein
MQKHEARRVKQEIDRILWDVWDPIGVKDMFPDDRDEYSSYVNGVFLLLTGGANDTQLAQHLLFIVTEAMGLSGATMADMCATVTALRVILLSTSS